MLTPWQGCQARRIGRRGEIAHIRPHMNIRDTSGRACESRLRNLNRAINQNPDIKDVERLTLASTGSADVNRTTVNTDNERATSG